MKISLRVILFILFFYFISKNNIFADTYFGDNFNSVNDSWNYYCNYYAKNSCGIGSTNIAYVDGSINLSTSTSNFPVVVSKGELIPQTGNFLIEVTFRYPETTYRGVGLGIGFTGSSSLYKLFSQFGIWKDRREGFKFYYNDFITNSCSNFTDSTNDVLDRQTIRNINLSDSLWHLLEIYKINNNYYVYIDRSLNSDPIFTTEIKNNCIPKTIWFGNFISDDGGNWTTFSLDSIKITSDIERLPTPTLALTPTEVPSPTPTSTPTLTPTPTLTIIPTEMPTPTLTPTPTPILRKKKIFILPGLGASWNSEAIVYGNNVSDNDWKMTPFVNNYDGLIELLNKNNLEKDKDYFVWNYDWRRSIEEIKNKFDSFVKSKNLDSSDDIYLVGHSLGGVVARIWAQENKDNNNIKQVIDLGSPNLGSLDTYSVWNGGEILKYNGFGSVAFQILLGLQNKGFVVVDINKIHNFAPIAKDLLPTFDYVNKNSNRIAWNNLTSYNDYLKGKNDSVSDVSSKLFSAVGVGLSTPEFLNLGGRSVYDKVLNLWPDGEILSFIDGSGDGTVLKNSAAFGVGENKSEIISDHGAITNNSLSLIANKLGLENKSIDFVYTDNFADSLVVFVGSPATAELDCGSDVYKENSGFIVAKNKNYTDCNLVLSPTGSGLVHLVLGNTENNEWNYVEKNVGVGTSEIALINFNNGQLVEDTNSEEFLKNQIRTDLNTLGLVNSVSDFEHNYLTKVAVRIFEYRKENNERIISQRLLDNLFNLANLIGWDKRINDFTSLSNYVNSVENKVEIKLETSQIATNSAVSLAILGDLRDKSLVMSNNGEKTSYSMGVVLASGYGTEILRD